MAGTLWYLMFVHFSQTIPQAHSEMVTWPPSLSQSAFSYLLCGRINTFPHRRHIKNFYTSLLLPFLFSLQNILLSLPLITTQFYHLSRLSANTTSSLISLLPAELKAMFWELPWHFACVSFVIMTCFKQKYVASIVLGTFYMQKCIVHVLCTITCKKLLHTPLYKWGDQSSEGWT